MNDVKHAVIYALKDDSDSMRFDADFVNRDTRDEPGILDDPDDYFPIAAIEYPAAGRLVVPVVPEWKTFSKGQRGLSYDSRYALLLSGQLLHAQGLAVGGDGDAHGVRIIEQDPEGEGRAHRTHPLKPKCAPHFWGKPQAGDIALECRVCGRQLRFCDTTDNIFSSVLNGIETHFGDGAYEDFSQAYLQARAAASAAFKATHAAGDIDLLEALGVDVSHVTSRMSAPSVKPITHHTEWWNSLRGSKQHRLRARLRHEIAQTLFYWGAPRCGWSHVTLHGGDAPDLTIELKRDGR